MNKSSKIIFIIFTVMGAIFTVAGIGVFVLGRQFVSDADEVTATITNIERSIDYSRDIDHDVDVDVDYDVYVDYEYNGERYTDVKLNAYSSNMHEGKVITILVDPNNPYHINTLGGSVLVGIIFCVIGLIFMLVGGIAFMVSAAHKRKVARLLETGRRLMATVDSIDRNVSVSVNGVHPKVIKCSYHDVDKDVIYRFKSDNIWTDPSIVFPIGSDVPVYVDAQDYSKYHVDVESTIEARVVDYT